MSLINNHFKTFLISLLSLTLLFSISCSNEGTTGGGTGGETETTVTIDAKDFPTELLGTYRDENVASAGFRGDNFDTKVSTIEVGIQKTKIEGTWLKDGATPPDNITHRAGAFIEKWKQTKKGGKTIKLEGEYVNGEEKYTIIYDYASETLIGTCVYPDVTALFNGKKIS